MSTPQISCLPPPRRYDLRPEDSISRDYLLNVSPVARLISRYPGFLDTIDESYTVLRTGLLIRGVSFADCESIGGHTSKLTYDTQIFPAEKRGVNKDEMAIYAVVHDPLVETGRGWDIPPSIYSGIPKKQKEQCELAWLEENIDRIDPIADELREFWLDYNYGRTPSARLVKQLDKPRAVVEARVAGISERVIQSEFIQSARALIEDQFLKNCFDKWTGTADSKESPEAIYRDLLHSYPAYELNQRRIFAAVSRNPRYSNRPLMSVPA